MQQTCHVCGGELPAGSGESPFCPQCGTPQLRLGLENQSVETGGDPPLAADGTPSTGALPPPPPRQIDWKMAIRYAAMVAAIGSVLSVAAIRVDLLSPVSFVWIMSASLITLGLYQRRLPAARIDVGVGARIGVMVGLCLAIGLGVGMAGWGVVSRFGLHTMGSFDAALTNTIAQGQRSSAQWMATPLPPDVTAFEQTPEFHAGYVLASFAMGSALLLMVSTVGGAFAGLLRRQRGRPA
jgi:hypothetical protein